MGDLEDDDEPMNEPIKQKGKSRINDKREDQADKISREVVDFIATAVGDPFFISVEVATIVQKAENMDDRVKIAESLFRAGVIKSIHHRDGILDFNNYLLAFEYLVPSMTISFPDYLRILCTYNFKPNGESNWDILIEQIQRTIICRLLRKARYSFNCDHWTFDEYTAIVAVVPKVFLFLIGCMKSELPNDFENKDRRILTEFETIFLEYFSSDVFFIDLLKLSDLKYETKTNRLMPTVIGDAIKQFDKKNREIVFEKSDTTLSHEWNHSIVDTTISVFVSARMNVSNREMVQDIRHAAEMVGVGQLWMWKSAVRSAIQLMCETRSSPHSSIRSFVEVFFLDRLPAMIKLEIYTLRELLQHTARDMQSALSKLPVHVWDLFQDGLERHGYVGGRIAVDRFHTTVPDCELITRSPIALRAIEGIKNDDIISILPSLFDPSCIAFNSVLAHLSIDGEIHRKTIQLADVNRLMEVPNDEVDGELRWKRFDATFCLLLHTYYTVNRMTLRRIVCGGGPNLENRNGVFYRWVTRFGRRDTTPNDKRDMENTLDEKKEERTEKAKGFIRLLNSQCPLTENDSNYSDLFDILPYLAQLLLEEAGKNTFDISTALSTLSTSPSIVYSLLMWLYCLDHSDARVSLVKNMDRVMREMHGTDNTWKFMIHSSSILVKEMMKGARTMDCVNSSPMVAAFMIKPLRYRHEVAKAEMVKKGITVASRGNCLPLWVIDLIESGNHAAKYDWVHLWVREITKLIVMDEMTEMGELLMGAAMIAPLQTCTQICQKLGDTILNDSNENDYPPRPEMAPCLFVFLSRFTAQMMMMGMWAIAHGEARIAELAEELGEEAVPKKKLRFYVDDLEDELEMTRAHKDEMFETITALFNRMLKACQKGYLRNSVSAVSLILKEIAIGPDIECSVALKKMVPHELLELLAVIDPLSVPFELYCSFVSDKDKRLEYLCKWKNWKGVEYPEMEYEDDDMRIDDDIRVGRML
ncbi:lin-25 [Pristionchus pacificus]|uniref:Lin-25 n=1 Tax=Pristionchus pacificus TaxID=54126 RepID=A0A2A6CRT6_PRIPA|nr:lin-25 [Pristionchus pacificus]|eukprot:PDM80741.1 lin-25 [Pristionchus pacificus]